MKTSALPLALNSGHPANEFWREESACQHCQDTILQLGSQLLGPLGERLRRDADCVCSFGVGLAGEQPSNVGLAHTQLNHGYINESTLDSVTMVKLAAMSTTQGERLLAALNLRQKSRAELAEALGVTVQGLSQVITGANKAMTAENTAKAAKFLQVNWYWLATGDGGPEDDDAGARLTKDQEALLADFSELLEEERAAWRQRLREEADRMRKLKAAVRREMEGKQLMPKGKLVRYEGSSSGTLISPKSPQSRKRGQR